MWRKCFVQFFKEMGNSGQIRDRCSAEMDVLFTLMFAIVGMFLGPILAIVLNEVVDECKFLPFFKELC